MIRHFSESTMNTKQRSHLEALLRDEQGRLAGVVKVLAVRRERARMRDEFEAGTIGASPRDDDAIEAREIQALAEVTAALELLRTAPNRYGICATCGKNIPIARLAILPAARFCERHANHARVPA
jgi:RNA polymerase-binding transcription factor DksA